MISGFKVQKLFVLSAFGAVDQFNDLPYLDKEYQRVKDILDDLTVYKDIGIVGRSERFYKPENLITKIQKDKRILTVFHYSGHADKTSFWFKNQQVFMKGLAKILGGCENLKLIFLNGCSTIGQVKHILEAHQKVIVIGTFSPVKDDKANIFSISFFEALFEEMKTISEAYEIAVAHVQSISGESEITFLRAGRKELENDDDDKGQWGIFYNPQGQELLDWTIDAYYKKQAKEFMKKEKEKLEQKMLETFHTLSDLNFR